MNTYNVILDESMIQNTMETNVNESMDSLNWKLLAYFFFLGIIPSLVIYRTPVVYGSFSEEI